MTTVEVGRFSRLADAIQEIQGRLQFNLASLPDEIPEGVIPEIERCRAVAYGIAQQPIASDSNASQQIATDRLLSLPEVAAIYGISLFTARVKARTGEIPGAVRVGKFWRWNPVTLAAHLDGLGGAA